MSDSSDKGERGKRRIAESIRQSLEAAGYRIDIAKIMAIVEKQLLERGGDL